MITAKQFIVNNEELIQKEFDGIFEHISKSLDTGILFVDWHIDIAPYGATGFIGQKVKNELEENGWECEFEVSKSANFIKFRIKPDVGALL